MEPRNEPSSPRAVAPVVVAENEPASRGPNYQPPAAALADRLHAGENISDDRLTPDLLQIKKLRKYIKENPIDSAFWRWPEAYRGLTDDEAYDKLASDPYWMRTITGSDSPLSIYSTASNFVGSRTHTTPSNYSSSPKSREGISDEEAQARKNAIMEQEKEDWKPSRWTPSGLMENRRPYYISKADRNRKGLPEFKKAKRWSSSTRSFLTPTELNELLDGKSEDERYFQLAKRSIPHEEIVELLSYGPPPPFKRATYFKMIGLGGMRKVSRKNRKSTRRVKRRNTRRN